MNPTAPDEVVRVASATHPMKAHAMEQALQARGVYCKVVGDYLDAGLGDIPGLQAELWVKKKDLAQAEAILKEMADAGLDEKAGDPEA
jgi:hypothetical protein